MDTIGTILRIEKISPHDGQGLRTVIFFKGCPMQCAWCSTPESQLMPPQLFYKKSKCRLCGRCIEACLQGALTLADNRQQILRDQKRCINCFACVAACHFQAVGIYGQTMTVAEVMKHIRKDEMFYYYSDGGVTLSGGDILCQAGFAQKILRACQRECINTSAELAMYGSYDDIAMVLEYLDSYHVDIKLMNDRKHKEWTGVSNTVILDNILHSSEQYPKKPLYVRVPLIPGINDSKENIEATVAFCTKLKNCQSLEFLPYHSLGSSTYEYIGRPYRCKDIPSMTFEEAYNRVADLPTVKLPFAVKISGKGIG